MFHNFQPALTAARPSPQSHQKTPLRRLNPAVRFLVVWLGWTFAATAVAGLAGTAQASTAQTSTVQALTDPPSQAPAASSQIVAALADVPPPLDRLHPTQVLNRGNGAEPESLDPALTSSTNAAAVLRDVLEGLTSTTAQGKIVGGVAHGWQRLDDLTWAFDLRPARWSNGDPVTADDFVYSFRRFFTPATASIYSTTFQDFLLNAREIVEGSQAPESLGAHAESPTRLILRTQFPVAFLPELMAHGSFLPVHRATVERHGSQWTRPANWVGNGAFTLTEWRVNDRIVVTRRPDYWDAENVRIAKVTFFPIESEAAETKLYQSGQLDMTTTIAPGSYPLHLKQRPEDIRNSPALTVRYYSLNNEDPLLKDVRVRQALSMVIDRDIMAQRIVDDGSIPAYSALVRGVAGGSPTTYDWASWSMEKRVQHAQALLKEAGIKPGTRLSLVYNTSDYHKKMALFVASEWRTKLGLNTDLENMEFRALIHRRQSGEYQVARDAWVADYNDAFSLLTIVRCDRVQNSCRSCHREGDNLILAAQAELDPASRSAMQTRATEMIMLDYPSIHVLQSTSPRLVKPYLGGYGDNNPLDRYRSRDLYIQKH